MLNIFDQFFFVTIYFNIFILLLTTVIISGARFDILCQNQLKWLPGSPAIFQFGETDHTPTMHTLATKILSRIKKSL
jgi:hypothetical protein